MDDHGDEYVHRDEWSVVTLGFQQQLGRSIQLLKDPKRADPKPSSSDPPTGPWDGRYQYTVTDEDGNQRPVSRDEGEAIRQRVDHEEHR